MGPDLVTLEDAGWIFRRNKIARRDSGTNGRLCPIEPPLDWDVQAMHEDGNFVTIRSRANKAHEGALPAVDAVAKIVEIVATRELPEAG